MDQYFEALQRLFEQYGNLVIFPILFIEVVPFVGYLAPAITLLIFAGFLLGGSPQEFVTTTMVAYAAVLLADNMMYFLGRYSSGKWSALKSVNSRANTVLEVISQQPRWLMFFYQFPPYFRMFLPFGLGMAKYPLRTWWAISLTGTFLYVAAFIGLGFLAFRFFNSLDTAYTLGKGLTYFITAYAAIYFVILTYQYIKKRRAIKKQM